MLKRLNRITKKKDFDRVFKSGQTSFNKIIGVKVVDSELKHSRFGLIVSNKVSKKAVDRNKIKRQIRGIIRTQIDKIKSGKDCVIITLPPILEKSYQEIENSLIRQFKKLRLYKKPES